MTWLISKALFESLPSLRVPAAAFLAENFSAGAQSAQLSVTDTPPPFWRRGKTMDASNLSQFGMTWLPSTGRLGAELLTLFLAAFPARTLARPEKAPVLTAQNRAFGANLPASFARYDRATSGWKTPQCSLLGELTEFSGPWPSWGMMRDGACWGLTPPDFHITEPECGWLPTPSGVNSPRSHTMGRPDEWGGASNCLRGTQIGAALSPNFEEIVIGWPIGWTALTPLETGRFQQWFESHGVSLARNNTT